MRYNVYMDVILRILTLLLFALWKAYWNIAAPNAEQEKPKTVKQLPLFHRKRVGIYLFLGIIGLLIFLPLVGVRILPIEKQLWFQLLGFSFVVVGFGIAILARMQLGANWANAYEYQIKERHELVTHGIYSYIRHPIYTGIWLALIGAELVASSYLFIVFILFLFLAYKQGKKEEALLEKHFGNSYRGYRKRTKMLLPFIL